MITLESFNELVDRNAHVTLIDGRTTYYSGSFKSMPDKYGACEVKDFTMNDNGALTFKIKVRAAKVTDIRWKEGSLRVHSSIYHYWVKQYDEGSEYGIDGGRVSKMTIKRNGKIVCNYDRGWDVEPVDENTELAKEILLHEYN